MGATIALIFYAAVIMVIAVVAYFVIRRAVVDGILEADERRKQ